MANGFDVVIVGGGVIGMSIAWALAKAGQRVCVIEARPALGIGATAAAGGMLAPTAELHPGAVPPPEFTAMAWRSALAYPEFTQELAAETGIDPGYDTTGTLVAALTETEAQFLAGEARRERPVMAEWLSRAQVEARFPAWPPPDACLGALFCPMDRRVDPRSLAAALTEALRRRGVTIRLGTKVGELVREDGRCVGVSTPAGPVRGSWTVLASGAWALGGLRGLRPVKGQLAVLEAPARPAMPVIRSMGGYVVPQPGGRVLAGATSEAAGFDETITAGGMAAVLQAAVKLVPTLASARFVEGRAGPRPGTSDGLPLLGRGGMDGLWVACGHFRNGILLAPETARLTAEALGAGIISANISIFKPIRFESE